MARNAVHTELQLYLREINGIDLLSAQEEKDLGWLIVNDSCPEAKDRMIKANLRLVIAISKNYSNRGLPLLDLIEFLLSPRQHLRERARLLLPSCLQPRLLTQVICLREHTCTPEVQLTDSPTTAADCCLENGHLMHRPGQQHLRCCRAP